MISGTTKNGVKLYVTFTEDVYPNEGGYYCEVYLDDSSCNEVDNFVIHPFELIDGKTPEDVAKEYIAEYDDIPILCKEFNKVYDAISNADEMLNEFYMKHILYNKNVDMDSPIWHQIRQAMEKIGVVKCLAYEIAEHYSWDDE